MKDLVIEVNADFSSKVRESRFRRDMIKRDTGIGSVAMAIFFIVESITEKFHIFKFFNISKEIKEEDRRGIEARSTFFREFMSDERSYEREIDKRRDKARFIEVTFRGDRSKPFNVGIMREEMVRRFRKRSGIFKINFDVDII